MKKIYYVYGLIDPETKELRYIGKGCFDRVSSHIKERLGHVNPGKQKWIDDLSNKGLVPDVIYFKKSLTNVESLDLESVLLAHYGHQSNKCRLLNLRIPNLSIRKDGTISSVSDTRKHIIQLREYYKESKTIDTYLRDIELCDIFDVIAAQMFIRREKSRVPTKNTERRNNNKYHIEDTKTGEKWNLLTCEAKDWCKNRGYQFGSFYAAYKGNRPFLKRYIVSSDKDYESIRLKPKSNPNPYKGKSKPRKIRG